MADADFRPTELLGGYLQETDPDGAVKLARELCGQLEGDPDSFHGGIWPGSVELNADGSAILGAPNHTAPNQRPADQVEYLAPEYFWDSAGSAAADVYSVGLMLYAGCNGGYLPFQPKDAELTDKERSAALRRRMKGEKITAPEGVSPELKKVIEKALAYEPEDRYITSREFLSALGRTDEALPSAAAVAAGAAASADIDTPEAAGSENTPVSGDASEGQAAAVAGAAAVAAGVSAAAGGAPPDEASPTPEEDASDLVKEAVPAEKSAAGTAAATTAAGVAAAGIDGAARHASAGGSGAHTRTGTVSGQTPRPQYSVQKDFEKKPRAQSRSAVPAAQRKKKRSKAVPILCCIAAAVLLGSVAYMTGLFRGNPESSEAFATPEAVEEVPSPIVVSPSPSATPKPTNTPRPTKDPAKVSPSPSPDAAAGETGTGSGAGSENGTVTIGGNGTGTAAANIGAGTDTGTGTAGGSGTTGTGTGTGGGSGTTGTGSGGSGYTVNAASGTVYLTGNGVRVRTGPGTNYGIIGAVSRGDWLTRTGTVANGWTQVTYNGVTAYVYSQYLTDTPPATAEPAPTATVEPTPATTPEPSPSATPEPPPVASTFTVTAGALTYADAENAAGGALAAVASDDDFDVMTAQMEEQGLQYAWLGAECDGLDWRWADGVPLDADDAHWGDGYPVDGDVHVLLARTESDGWCFISVPEDFDPAGDIAYDGVFGYVTGA